ncbi:hypothetical protein [Nocardioides sp.]|uniref:hypothetical protein n=1 Tax=Nocardioides sp. TaxID=35761 RepID=UPI002B269F34|nr:hypothetical protein [Nocardioides sp.]
MRTARRTALAGALFGVLALTLGACGGESGPVDDGTYSALQAGAPAVLAERGIALVSPDRPAAAAPRDVVDALGEERLFAAELSLVPNPVQDAVLALDPTQVAGLLFLVGNATETDADGDSEGGRYVVLGFADLDSAILFAQSEPTIFHDADLEEDRSAYFSGTLVSYYAPEGTNDATERFQAALEALAG